MTRIINFSEEIKKKKLQELKKPVVITFLGFMGKKSCFSDIHNLFQNHKNWRILEASPQDPNLYKWWKSPFAKIDAYSMKKKSLHLGLGTSKNQAASCFEELKDKINSETPIILCGHSQGGLIALEFFKKYHSKLNIKGIVSITTPFYGVTIFGNLRKKKILKKILQKSDSFFERNFMPLIISKVYMNLISIFGKIFRLTTIDFFPSGSLKKKREKDFFYFEKIKLPFLNIVASCEDVISLKNHISKEDFSSLVNGEIKKNDNILSVEDQCIKKVWEEAKQIEIYADHGMFNIKNISKIFNHPKALEEIYFFVKILFKT